MLLIKEMILFIMILSTIVGEDIGLIVNLKWQKIIKRKLLKSHLELIQLRILLHFVLNRTAIEIVIKSQNLNFKIQKLVKIVPT